MKRSMYIPAEALTKGVWLERRNAVRQGQSTGRYLDRPTDLIMVEEVEGDRVRVARFERWEDGNPVFVRTSRLDRFKVERSRFTIVPCPKPPVAAAAVRGPAPEPETASVHEEVRALRLAIAGLRETIADGIKTIVVAMRGHQLELPKMNGTGEKRPG